MKNVITKIPANPIGAGLGALALYFIVKKTGHTSMLWVGGAIVAGVIAGAHVQAAFKAQSGASKSASLAK
jgi:hypothetical protein